MIYGIGYSLKQRILIEFQFNVSTIVDEFKVRIKN